MESPLKKKQKVCITQHQSILALLPLDLFFMILMFLDLKSIGNLEQTCKEYYHLIMGNFWKRLYKQKWIKFDKPEIFDKYYGENFAWKETYKHRFLVEKDTNLKNRMNESDESSDDFGIHLRKANFLYYYNTSNKPEEKERHSHLIVATEECKLALLCSKQHDNLKTIYYLLSCCFDELHHYGDYSKDEKIYLLNKSFEYCTAALQCLQNIFFASLDDYIYLQFGNIYKNFIEFSVTKEELLNYYHKSEQNYLTSFELDYSLPDITWKLGTLNYETMKKLISMDDYVSAKEFLSKANYYFSLLKPHNQQDDLHCGFLFNTACVYKYRYDFAKREGKIQDSEIYYGKMKNNIEECIRLFSHLIEDKHMNLSVWDFVRNENWFIKLKQTRENNISNQRNVSFH